ncbi:MAG: hypothetical protein RR051_03055, partial [Clostridiales bacterium]
LGMLSVRDSIYQGHPPPPGLAAGTLGYSQRGPLPAGIQLFGPQMADTAVMNAAAALADSAKGGN